jgi:hypothetical protein
MKKTVKLFEQYFKVQESMDDPKSKKFLAVLTKHPELSILPISKSPEGKPISKIYRTVRQGDLFNDIYGTHDVPWNIMALPATYVGKGKIPKLPPATFMTMLNVEGESDQPGWEHTTDWTVDPDYYYQVHDEVIRVCLDFNKVKNIVGNENILNLLHDGEAEIRLRNKIPVLETLDHIEIVEDFFEEDVEGEYGVDRAIKKWFPKELMPYLKLVDEMPFLTPQSCREMANYYKGVYAEYGVVPIKPYGNTWIDQKK